MKLIWSLVVAAAVAGLLGWSLLLEPRAAEESVASAEERAIRESSEEERQAKRAELDPIAPLVVRPEERRTAVGASAITPTAHDSSQGPSEVRSSSKQATPEELADFRAYLETTRQELRGEEAQERRRSIERRTLDLERGMPKLAKKLELSDEQSRKLLALLRREQDRESEYVLLWERGAEDAQIEELRQRDRDGRLQELRQFLTEAQVRELARH